MPADVIMGPPRTMLEVYQSLPEGTPVQLIKNKLIMAPSPNELHIIDPATESAEGFYLTKGKFVPLVKTEKRIKSRLLKTDISF